MFAKQDAQEQGTTRALHANMYDADAIEAINFEQLATVTDRLLLRGGRISKRRPSMNRISTQNLPQLLTRPVEVEPERTVFVRSRKKSSFTGAALLVSGVLVAFAASVVTFV